MEYKKRVLQSASVILSLVSAIMLLSWFQEPDQECSYESGIFVQLRICEVRTIFSEKPVPTTGIFVPALSILGFIVALGFLRWSRQNIKESKSMLCFNHPERQAVGTCKACHRGICQECMTDLGHGIACKDKHEQQVEALEKIVRQSEKISSITPKTRNAAPLFYGFMGIVFAGFGLLKGRGVTDFTFILGAGFIVFGVYIYIYNKKAYGSKD